MVTDEDIGKIVRVIPKLAQIEDIDVDFIFRGFGQYAGCKLKRLKKDKRYPTIVYYHQQEINVHYMRGE